MSVSCKIQEVFFKATCIEGDFLKQKVNTWRDIRVFHHTRSQQIWLRFGLCKRVAERWIALIHNFISSISKGERLWVVCLRRRYVNVQYEWMKKRNNICYKLSSNIESNFFGATETELQVSKFWISYSYIFCFHFTTVTDKLRKLVHVQYMCVS